MPHPKIVWANGPRHWKEHIRCTRPSTHEKRTQLSPVNSQKNAKIYSALSCRLTSPTICKNVLRSHLSTHNNLQKRTQLSPVNSQQLLDSQQLHNSGVSTWANTRSQHLSHNKLTTNVHVTWANTAVSTWAHTGVSTGANSRSPTCPQTKKSENVKRTPKSRTDFQTCYDFQNLTHTNEDSATSMLTRHLICKMKTLGLPCSHAT